MMHLESLESTQEARVALGYRFERLLRFFRALQTSRLHHNSIYARYKSMNQLLINGFRHCVTGNNSSSFERLLNLTVFLIRISENIHCSYLAVLSWTDWTIPRHFFVLTPSTHFITNSCSSVAGISWIIILLSSSLAWTSLNYVK